MKEIVKKILQFRDERNWKQFHNVKDLLLGLNIEVGELQELFLWKHDEALTESERLSVQGELADIYIFLIYLSDKLDIDLENATETKLQIHESHYPKKASKNKTTKYPYLKNESR